MTMRRFFFTVIFILLLSSCAYGDAALYRGTGSIGAVPIFETQTGFYVPVDAVGRLLGFASRTSNEEVVLTRGKTTIRVIAGSAAAWRGNSIAPLQSSAIAKNGKIWIDSPSAISLFQIYAGQGVADRLRFSKISGASQTTTKAITESSRSEVEFGKFNEQPDIIVPPIPERQIARAQTTPTQTTQTSQTIPTVPAVTPAQTIPTPTVPTVTPAQPTPAPASTPAQPEPAANITASTPQTEATPAVATTQASQTDRQASKTKPKLPSSVTQAVNAASRTVTKKAAVAKAQPKHETFKPSDNKKPVHESWSGTIQSIRWTSQEGANRKIRAVIVADDEADPQVYMQEGKLHALFASSIENGKSLASPYDNIKTELNVNLNGAELIFTAPDMTRAEKTILASPRRVVFDFFFPADMNIEQEPKAQPQEQSQPQPQVQPQAQTQKQEQKQEQPQTPVQQAAKPDPIIIINNNNQQPRPVVQTPASSITIPAITASSGRKVIVVDPGHGGKDPGASANGVTEKDVNLGIGLELERILTAQGFRVIMTRNTDVYLKLQERTDIANNANADLFVSIHVNALPSKTSATGFEIYIMALPTDKDAMDLAKIENREYVEGKGYDAENVDRRTELLLHILGDMQQNNKISESTDFAAALYNAGARSGLPMRRVAQAPFFVLRGAGMPAVLIETGFVTNAAEAQKLTTAAYQNQIARAMAAGIANYLK